jgi:hypothetical protein
MPVVNSKLVVSQISHRQIVYPVIAAGTSNYTWDPRKGGSLHVTSASDNVVVNVSLHSGYVPVIGDNLRLIVTTTSNFTKVVVNFNSWGFNSDNTPVEFQYVGASGRNPNWRKLSQYSASTYKLESARLMDTAYSVEFSDTTTDKSDICSSFAKRLDTGHLVTVVSYIDSVSQRTETFATEAYGSQFCVLGTGLTDLRVARGAFTNAAKTQVAFLSDTPYGASTSGHVRSYLLSDNSSVGSYTTPSFAFMSCPPAGDGDGLIMASGSDVYVSTDFGVTWSTQSVASMILAVATYSNRFYYLTSTGSLYSIAYASPGSTSLVTTFAGTPVRGGLVVDYFGAVAFTDSNTYYNTSGYTGTWGSHPAQFSDLLAVSRGYYIRGTQASGVVTLGSFSGWDCAYGNDLQTINIQPLSTTFDSLFNISLQLGVDGTQLLSLDSNKVTIGYGSCSNVAFNSVLRSIK